MELPNFRRGIELTSIELNKLSAAIRAASITSVVGGTLTRTPGGTTLIVNDQVRGGSTEGGVSRCPFAVSDVSTSSTLKIEIAWGLIWNMLPTGMFPDNKPPLRMDVTETCYVYSKIQFSTSTLLPTNISFSIESELVENTETIQYNLIAVVTIKEDVEPKSITSIKNICQQPFPSPCSLR